MHSRGVQLQWASAGVPCCLNADDPLCWAASQVPPTTDPARVTLALGGQDTAHGLLREFRVCREILGLDDYALAALARYSFEHSAAPADVKRAGIAAVDAWLRS